MRVLDVPTTSISEVKRSPVAVFERSEKAENGVYVLSHGSVAGVMLAREMYEQLVRRVDELEEELCLLEASYRIENPSEHRFRDEDVRDARARAVAFSEDDGWE